MQAALVTTKMDFISRVKVANVCLIASLTAAAAAIALQAAVPAHSFKPPLVPQAPQAPPPSMAPVRLYVGGLPPDVDEEQLRARFTPFGAVSACSIAPPKVYGAVTFPRNFGHVELEPKDEATLRRCISAYNGCRWKGAVLKCALARPHHLERLREAEQEAEAQVGASPSTLESFKRQC